MTEPQTITGRSARDTVASCIERAARRLEAAGLHFGHGTDNARDEAAWLVLHCVGAPLDGRFDRWGAKLSASESAEVERLLEARCSTRKPLAYLTGTAWFAGLEFEVNPDVLVPRSPLAELILDGYRPWLDPERPLRILDLCTGCGCIAVATAHYLPRARVDAADISAAALRVAHRNVQRHGLESRVSLVESNLFHSIPANRYDLIVSNPPYVPAAAVSSLPPEHHAEPALGLASGADGLDAVLEILVDAADFLADDGILVVEVGESEHRLSEALPRVPFLWLEFESGGGGVFLLERAQLLRARGGAERLIGERTHVA